MADFDLFLHVYMAVLITGVVIVWTKAFKLMWQDEHTTGHF